MKRKELYNYIREEIIGTLSEESVAWSSSTKSQAKQHIDKSKLSSDAKKQAKDEIDQNVSGLISNVSEVDLDEMARKAGSYRPGSKFEDAKEIYATGLYADLLKAIEDAGENGVTQKELGSILGKGDGSSLNLILKNLRIVGIISGGPLAAAPKPEKGAKEEEPEVEAPETEEPETEAPADDWEKPEEEETPEEEPTAVSDKEVEKTVGKAYAELSPEEEKLYNTFKTAITNKAKELNDKKASDADKAKAKAAIDSYKTKEDVKKVFAKRGLKLIDFINGELNK